MDFRELRYLTAIAEYQNITKAAESLYVGQPTLSKFLSSLEEELGIRLFQRQGHRYVLTYAGERYLERAGQILRLKDDLDAEISDIIKKDIGVLSVAFANMRCSYMLPVALPAFHRRYPNVRVNVFEGNSDANDLRLLNGQVDVAFYSRPDRQNPLLEYTPLAAEELLICTCVGHPLGRSAVFNPDSPCPKLELSALCSERVIMMRPEQRTRQIMDGILRERKICYENVLVTSSIPAIIGLVSAGYGVSFVFDSHLKHRPASQPLDCYSFGEPRTVCDFVAATRRGGYLSQYTQAFIEIVRQSV